MGPKMQGSTGTTAGKSRSEVPSSLLPKPHDKAGWAGVLSAVGWWECHALFHALLSAHTPTELPQARLTISIRRSVVDIVLGLLLALEVNTGLPAHF